MAFVLMAPLFAYAVRAGYTYSRSHYMGPGNTMPVDRVYYQDPNTNFDSYYQQSLDDASFHHDTKYVSSNKLSGRSRRVAKTKADYDMAGETFFENPVVGAAMFAAASARVLTFNEFNMPWDE